MLVFKGPYYVLIITSFIWQVNSDVSFSDACLTPNNEKAKCIPIRSCPILFQALNSSDSGALEFVRKSVCDIEDQKVCCGSSSNFIQPTFEKLSRTKKFCGKQHSDDYFHTHNNTIINEFPWLAAFAYKHIERKEPLSRGSFKCGGSLINNRYVLTAAHCVVDKKFKLVLVRLGEYHLRNDTDCIEDSDLFECSDPTIDVGVEDIIVYPEYSSTVISRNDIALVKLNRTIVYTDYIRPICLPLPNTSVANIDDVLITSGWGREASGFFVDIKKKIYVKLVDSNECEAQYNKVNRNADIKIDEDRFCFTHLVNNSEVSCGGDTGAPVMFSRRNRWYQEGIVSFGPRACLSEFPVVNTKVVSYLKWIEDTIES